MMKKEYNAPVISVKKFVAESLLQAASNTLPKNDGKTSDGSDASSKTQFTIWEYMNAEE